MEPSSVIDDDDARVNEVPASPVPVTNAVKLLQLNVPVTDTVVAVNTF